MGSDCPPKPIKMVRKASQSDGRWVNADLQQDPPLSGVSTSEKQAFAFAFGFLTACFGVIFGELSCLEITHFYFRQ